MNKLTAEHFFQAHEMLAGYYGTQAPNLKGAALAFKALTTAAPWLTQEQFDWALCRSMARCQFHPRIPDFLQELYERDSSGLPELPDIDPRYANEFQVAQLNKAKDRNAKLEQNCPFDSNQFRKQHIGLIPGTENAKNLHTCPSPKDLAGWDSQGALDDGRPRSTVPGLDDHNGRQQNANIPF
jgi:hypothetical protein